MFRSEYGDNEQPCGRVHPVCHECSKIRLDQMLTAGKKHVVIPVAQWRRLVEYMNDWMQSCPCDGACDVCVEEGAIKAIIASVEVPHD